MLKHNVSALTKAVVHGVGCVLTFSHKQSISNLWLIDFNEKGLVSMDDYFTT